MSTLFPQRVTRWSIVVFDRGSWGREEVTVEEVRPNFGRGEPHWRVIHGASLWNPKVGDFCWPSGEEQWAAIRHATAEAALAEAPRACAVVLGWYADRIAKHDAEQVEKVKGS